MTEKAIRRNTQAQYAFTWRKSFAKYKVLYFMLLPGIIYFIIFKYLPMAGVVIAFENFKPFDGIQGIFTSQWVGLKHFQRFFSSRFAGQLISNSLLISLYKLLWGFPAPILLAILLNAIPRQGYKRTIQTVSYLPHFLSMVIVCSIVRTVTTTDGGIISIIVKFFGGEPVYYLASPKYFRSVLVISSIWQTVGWGSIIYLAGMTGIDPQLYEAATVDGAKWYHKILHVTLPAIAPIISLMLILRIGQLLEAGFEQVFLLYSPPVYSVGDIIDTFVYREGILNMNYSYSAAVSVFKSVIALALVLSSNFIAKKMGHEGIW